MAILSSKKRRWLAYLGLLYWLAGPFVFADGSRRVMDLSCERDPDCDYYHYMPFLEISLILGGPLLAILFWGIASRCLNPELYDDKQRQSAPATLVLASLFGLYSFRLGQLWIADFPLHGLFWLSWTVWLIAASIIAWKLRDPSPHKPLS